MSPDDWMDEGQWMAEDRYEDEGDGIIEYLGEARLEEEDE